MKFEMKQSKWGNQELWIHQIERDLDQVLWFISDTRHGGRNAVPRLAYEWRERLQPEVMAALRSIAEQFRSEYEPEEDEIRWKAHPSNPDSFYDSCFFPARDLFRFLAECDAPTAATRN